MAKIFKGKPLQKGENKFLHTYTEELVGDINEAFDGVGNLYNSLQPEIKQLTLINGWTRRSGVNNLVQGVAVKQQGVVQVFGDIIGGSSTAICVLPFGLRPPNSIYVAKSHSGSTAGISYVTEYGDLFLEGISVGERVIFNIVFPVFD